MWKQITDAALAWELRKAGVLYWTSKSDQRLRYFTDDEGFGWREDQWLDRYTNAPDPGWCIHLEE